VEGASGAQDGGGTELAQAECQYQSNQRPLKRRPLTPRKADSRKTQTVHAARASTTAAVT